MACPPSSFSSGAAGDYPLAALLSDVNRADRIVFISLLALVLGVYSWLSVVGSRPWRFGEPQRDHYNLLVSGFLKGQLSLDAPVHPELVALKNPYDPAQRAGIPHIHDASLYQGRYYIYFGPAPAVTLLLPYRLLTGQMLPLGAAVTIFCGAGFGCALWLLLLVRRDFFPEAGMAVTAAAGLSLGFVSFAPILVRRHAMYEFAIAGGYLFSAAGLLFLYLALRADSRRILNLTLASLMVSLAIASRPIYLVVPAAFLPFVWRWWREAGQAGAHPASAVRSRVALTSALLGPLCAVGGVLALYNFLRFGSPTEFGVTYILSGVEESKVPHFGFGYLIYNVQAYLLHPPEVDRYFPFIHPAPITTPLPPFHFGTDALCGVLPVAPVVFAAAGLLLLPHRIMQAARPAGGFFAAVAWVGLSVLGSLLLFCAAMARYAGDFMPALAWLGAAGFLCVVQFAQRAGGGWARRFVSGAGGLVFLGSTLVSLLVGLLTLRGFEVARPEAFQATARFFDRQVARAERILGAEPGALVFRLTLPKSFKVGVEEEVFRTDPRPEAERVMVAYRGSQLIQVGLARGGGNVRWSAPIACLPGSVRELRIQSGRILPKASHPALEHLVGEERESVACLSVIALDGAPILLGWARALEPRIHAWSTSAVVGARFSGQVSLLRRESPVEAWSLTHGARALVRLSAVERNGPVLAVGLPLPETVASLSVARTGAGELSWRLVERQGAAWAASMPRDSAVPAMVELVKLRATGGAPWLLVIDGAVFAFARGEGAAVAPGQIERREELLISAGPMAFPAFSAAAPGARLSVRFPSSVKVGAREPLIVSGEPGRGDFLFVEYLPGNQFRLGWDHWGAPGQWSEPVAYEPGETGLLEIAAAGWSDFSQPGEIRLDLSVAWRGGAVWRAAVPCYPVPPDRFHVGRNPIGGSSCGEWFSGSIRY